MDFGSYKIFSWYQRMISVFTKHMTEDIDVYDVDMFTHDITQELFIETDPQNIDEDDFVYFQMALIYLVRDDMLMEYFGPEGLSIIHAELMNKAEHYYVYKEIFKEA
jgi:hypothetical protein